MHNAVLMQERQCLHNLSQVEAGFLLGECLQVVEQLPKVAANHILHDKMHPVLGAKGVEEVDHVRAGGEGHGVPLADDLLQHVLALYGSVGHDLHGIDGARGLLPHQEHASKGSARDVLDLVKVLEAWQARGRSSNRPVANKCAKKEGEKEGGGDV